MIRICVAAAAILLAVSPTLALNGVPAMHDPSTVIEADGKFYVYATGSGLPAFASDDGWTWHRTGPVMQAVPGGKPGPAVIARGGNNTWAPDVIRSGDKYFLYYAAPGTQPKAAIGLLVGRTLNPASPDYKWEDAGPVVWSDGVEDSNAIDPGVLRDPTNGTMWLTYGSYFGYIRLVELDPKTGKRLHPGAQPVNIAINSEASVMIFHDGWYYLLVTHGSCCAGANSSYNIRMGRSKKVIGPFLDNMGIDMLQGGGKLFAGSSGRHAELTIVPVFTAEPEQLWRIDQLTDGTYRLMPKRVPNAVEPLALSAIGSSMPTLEKFSAASDRQRWLLKTP